MMTLALFGDVHGHLRLLFELCRRWQEHNGRRIDAILQCGDMGWFPNPERLDRATRKYAKEDPDELGVSRFFARTAMETDSRLEETLCGELEKPTTVSANIYWTHGNHEDFEDLRLAVSNEDVVAVDRFNRLHWCRSGSAHVIAGLNVGFLGGGPENITAPVDPWQCVQRSDVEALAGSALDILITHPAPSKIGGESDRGSALVRNLIERVQPTWNVFGHHREPIPNAMIGDTNCRWLNDVSFARDGRLHCGCMAILDGSNFAVVDDPWFKAMGIWSWRS